MSAILYAGFGVAWIALAAWLLATGGELWGPLLAAVLGVTNLVVAARRR